MDYDYCTEPCLWTRGDPPTPPNPPPMVVAPTGVCGGMEERQRCRLPSTKLVPLPQGISVEVARQRCCDECKTHACAGFSLETMHTVVRATNATMRIAHRCWLPAPKHTDLVAVDHADVVAAGSSRSTTTSHTCYVQPSSPPPSPPSPPPQELVEEADATVPPVPLDWMNTTPADSGWWFTMPDLDDHFGPWSNGSQVYHHRRLLPWDVERWDRRL